MSLWAPEPVSFEEYEKRRIKKWEENENDWALDGFRTPPDWQREQDFQFKLEQAAFEHQLRKEAKLDNENRVQSDIHVHIHMG